MLNPFYLTCCEKALIEFDKGFTNVFDLAPLCPLLIFDLLDSINLALVECPSMKKGGITVPILVPILLPLYIFLFQNILYLTL
jgi:hypothetical protein